MSEREKPNHLTIEPAGNQGTRYDGLYVRGDFDNLDLLQRVKEAFPKTLSMGNYGNAFTSVSTRDLAKAKRIVHVIRRNDLPHHFYMYDPERWEDQFTGFVPSDEDLAVERAFRDRVRNR